MVLIWARPCLNKAVTQPVPQTISAPRLRDALSHLTARSYPDICQTLKRIPRSETPELRLHPRGQQTTACQEVSFTHSYFSEP